MKCGKADIGIIFKNYQPILLAGAEWSQNSKFHSIYCTELYVIYNINYGRLGEQWYCYKM